MEPSASDDQTAVDDFFGDQGDEGFESQKQQREWEALRRPHVSSGIREGAESARDAHLQRGFDEGFAAGAKVASEPGFLLGVSTVLDAFFAKQGCKIDSSSRSQAVLDTEVMTKDLADLQQASAVLRGELREVPVDGSLSIEKAQDACNKVTVVVMPESIKPSNEAGSGTQ